MFNGIAILPPVNLWVLSWWGSPHTLSITDVSLVCWFHLKVFTALFLISEGTADIEIRGLPEGGIVSVEGGVWEQKKDKELNHRHFIGLRLTDVELDLLDQGAACLSVSRSEYLRKLLLEKQIHHQIEVVADMNDLRKLVSEYGKIGSNLNQIAKHFNSGGSQSRAIENEIHQCITDLFLLRKEVLKLAGGMNGNRKTH